MADPVDFCLFPGYTLDLRYPNSKHSFPGEDQVRDTSLQDLCIVSQLCKARNVTSKMMYLLVQTPTRSRSVPRTMIVPEPPFCKCEKHKLLK